MGGFVAQGSPEDWRRQEGRERDGDPEGELRELRQGCVPLSVSVPVIGGNLHLLRAPLGELPPTPLRAPQGPRAGLTGGRCARSAPRARARTASRGFREPEDTRDRSGPQVRTARDIRSGVTPIQDPSPAGLPRAHREAGVGDARHGLGPLELRAEPLSPSLGGKPISSAELHWDGGAPGFPLLCPGTIRSCLSPCPLAMVHEPRHHRAEPGYGA